MPCGHSLRTSAGSASSSKAADSFQRASSAVARRQAAVDVQSVREAEFSLAGQAQALDRLFREGPQGVST